MAVAGRPNSKRQSTPDLEKERIAESYISRAGKEKEPNELPKEDKQQVTLHFDREFLSRLDALAKRRNLKRATWIYLKLSEILEAEEGKR